MEGAAAQPTNGATHNGAAAAAASTTMRRQVSNIDTPQHKTGIAGSTSNLVNAIVGSGIIGLPYAFRESGLIVGLILLVTVSYFTDKSLRIIVELATFHPKLKNIGVLTFEDLMSIPFGRNGSRFILISMFILAYGAMVSYMIIVKDSVPTVLGLDNSFMEREVIMLLISLVTMLPLSMMRDISQLAFTSGLSITADVILVLVVVIHAPISDTISEAGGFGQVLADNWINHRIFIGLGVLSTAMACQHSAFMIAGTLQDHTAARWALVTKSSLWIAGGLSTIFATAGYLGYLDETQGDVLNNFEARSVSVNAGRMLLAITMVFTYPMESFVARHVLGQLIFNGDFDNNSVGPNGEMVPESKMLGWFGRREKWTFYIYLMALIPALIFDDIGPVLSLTGSLGASAIAYIAPGLVYLGVNGEEFLEWVGARVQGGRNVKGHGAGEVELPVVGDATAQMQTVDVSSPPTTTDPNVILNASNSKPWWWFPTLMPVWVALASSGATSTKRFMTDLFGLSSGVPAPITNPNDHGDVIRATSRDFIMSIVFIVFGVVAAAFGVITNVYVQVKDVFFSPH